MRNILDCDKVGKLSKVAKELGNRKLSIKNYFFMNEEPLYEKTKFELRKLSFFLNTIENEFAKKEILIEEQKETIGELLQRLSELNYVLSREKTVFNLWVRPKNIYSPDAITVAMLLNPLGSIIVAFKASKFVKDVQEFVRRMWEVTGLPELQALSDIHIWLRMKNDELKEKIGKYQ